MLLLLALVPLGCGASTEDNLAKQSAFEWKCSLGDVRVVKVDRTTYRTIGCLQQADYYCPAGGAASGKRCVQVFSGCTSQRSRCSTSSSKCLSDVTHEP